MSCSPFGAALLGISVTVDLKSTTYSCTAPVVLQVHAAIDDMHAAGIQNWSLDLISGLPNLTEDVWQHSLEQAVAAQPAHISVYDLQVSHGRGPQTIAWSSDRYRHQCDPWQHDGISGAGPQLACILPPGCMAVRQAPARTGSLSSMRLLLCGCHCSFDWRAVPAVSICATTSGQHPGPHALALQVEQGTLFAKWYQPGAQPLPSDDTSAQMYRAASRSLQAAGFEHYELSNYAKPGMRWDPCLRRMLLTHSAETMPFLFPCMRQHPGAASAAKLCAGAAQCAPLTAWLLCCMCRCRHNMMYWQHGPFYAFGLGAASFLEGRRFSRPKKMKPYANWVSDFCTAAEGRDAGQSAAQAGHRNGHPGRLPGAHMAQQTPAEDLEDHVMLSLRLADGLDMQRIHNDYGNQAAQRVMAAVQRHVQSGLVKLQPLEARLPRICLADPDGFLVSNDIISDIFVAL